MLLWRALLCSDLPVGQGDSSCTEQGVVLRESSRNPRNPETSLWRVLSLEVGGVREAVTVSGVIANQKLPLGKRNEGWKWEYCAGLGWVFQFAAHGSCFHSVCPLYLGICYKWGIIPSQLLSLDYIPRGYGVTDWFLITGQGTFSSLAPLLGVRGGSSNVLAEKCLWIWRYYQRVKMEW